MFRKTACTLIVAAISLSVFIANAYTMPTDKLLAMSNKQLCDKAQSHWDKNELDSALICYNIIANRADKKQSKEEMEYSCRAFVAMANIYIPNFFDYERAMQSVLKSEQIALKNGFTGLLADIYELMAAIEFEKNQLEQEFAFSPKAFDFFRKAFYHSIKQERHTITLLSIINMTTVGLEHHKLNLIEDELKIFQHLTIKDTQSLGNFAKHQNAAAIYVLHQQYDSAINELRQLDNCLNMIEHMRPTYKSIIHENLFFVYRDMKDNAAALRELELLETITKEVNNAFGIIEVLSLKRDYLAELGNTALADKYELEYHKVKDKFMADTKVAKVNEEKVLFKLNEANHEIKELSYKQRIQQTELIAVAVVALLMLSLLVLAWVNYRRTKQKNETLYQHNMQLMANEDRLRQLHQAEEEATSAPTVKYRRSNMEGDDITQVMEKVDRVMESSTEIFSADFSLDRLAELTGESRIRLSQAINKVPGRTFYSILNGYRVREACRRMDDKEKYSGLTIEAIGQSVGFKNRSSFVAIFKRITGLTPSAYLKQTTEPDSRPSESKASQV